MDKCPKRTDGYGCLMLIVAEDSETITSECSYCKRRRIEEHYRKQKPQA